MMLANDDICEKVKSFNAKSKKDKKFRARKLSIRMEQTKSIMHDLGLVDTQRYYLEVQTGIDKKYVPIWHERRGGRVVYERRTNLPVRVVLKDTRGFRVTEMPFTTSFPSNIKLVCVDGSNQMLMEEWEIANERVATLDNTGQWMGKVRFKIRDTHKEANEKKDIRFVKLMAVLDIPDVPEAFLQTVASSASVTVLNIQTVKSSRAAKSRRVDDIPIPIEWVEDSNMDNQIKHNKKQTVFFSEGISRKEADEEDNIESLGPLSMESIFHALPLPGVNANISSDLYDRTQDSRLVKLVCPVCQMEKFESPASFMQHCEQAHYRKWSSWEEAVMECGVDVEVNWGMEDNSSGSPLMSPLPSSCSSSLLPSMLSRSIDEDKPGLDNTLSFANDRTLSKSAPLPLNNPSLKRKRLKASAEGIGLPPVAIEQILEAMGSENTDIQVNTNGVPRIAIMVDEKRRRGIEPLYWSSFLSNYLPLALKYYYAFVPEGMFEAVTAGVSKWMEKQNNEQASNANPAAPPTPVPEVRHRLLKIKDGIIGFIEVMKELVEGRLAFVLHISDPRDAECVVEMDTIRMQCDVFRVRYANNVSMAIRFCHQLSQGLITPVPSLPMANGMNNLLPLGVDPHRVLAVLAIPSKKNELLHYLQQDSSIIRRFDFFVATGGTYSFLQPFIRVYPNKRIIQCMPGTKGGLYQILAEIAQGRCHNVIFLIGDNTTTSDGWLFTKTALHLEASVAFNMESIDLLGPPQT